MKITIIGAGFVGTATGNGLVKHGNEVTLVDVDAARVEELRTQGFNVKLASEQKAIEGDVTMVCVPTPTKGGAIQLHYIKTAITEFATRLKTHTEYHVVVIRSTVPPKTTRTIVLPLIEKISGKKAGKDFGLCMQPEYLREATANADYERPWYILIGELDAKSGQVLEEIYQPFDAPIDRCSLDEAEFQKYVHNVYNAAKIAFFNEMRVVANNEGWDANKVFFATAESSEGIWNPLYGLRNYGPFDGSCLPKDTRALLQWGDSNGYDLGILRAIVAENIKHEAILGKNETVRVNYLANILP